jgi:hypothetical protein
MKDIIMKYGSAYFEFSGVFKAAIDKRIETRVSEYF